MEKKEKVKERIFWILVFAICIAMLALGQLSGQTKGVSNLLYLVVLLIAVVYSRKKEEKGNMTTIIRYGIVLLLFAVMFLKDGITALSVSGIIGVVIYLLVVVVLIAVYIKQYPFLKVFQESQKYLEETKDAVGYRKKCEEIYELAKQKKQKNLWRYSFNIASANVHCGEHELAEKQYVEILQDMETGKIKQSEVLAGLTAYNRMWNDIYRKDIQHMKQVEEESQEILNKVRQNEKMAKNWFFVFVFQAMANQEYEKAYEELKKLQNDTSFEMNPVIKEHIEFFELRVLECLGRIEESVQKAEELKQHVVLPCVVKQL
ncbi:MAG: hypothetical protein IJA36_04050 [Lachnospiraceae bacterium]|nr:hypothetical protein [Lachnospiraceae bacterium]